MNAAAETKGTAGPWIVGPFGQVWAASDISLVDGKWRENVPEPRIVASLTDPADGPLVAAAHDLYEALAAVEAALRKDSRGQTIVGDGVEYHLDGQTMYRAINKARGALAKARGEAR